MRRRAVPAVLAAVFLLTAGCSSGGDPSGADAGASSPAGTTAQSSPAGSPAREAPPAKGSVKVLRTVATGLNSPWGLAPLPGGDLLVSSRDKATV
ncbi:PQQ-dependent sugar dehydrogenase, partial [Streptomyces ardesiacus]